jgi:prevent-host-death family protein
MKSVGAFAAKTHLSELLQQVRRGEEVIIQKRGKSIAALVPFSSMGQAQAAERRARVLHGLREIRTAAKPGARARTLIELGRKR